MLSHTPSYGLIWMHMGSAHHAVADYASQSCVGHPQISSCDLETTPHLCCPAVCRDIQVCEVSSSHQALVLVAWYLSLSMEDKWNIASMHTYGQWMFAAIKRVTLTCPILLVYRIHQIWHSNFFHAFVDTCDRDGFL